MLAHRAAIYLRIWDYPEGLSPSLAWQHQECQKLAERLGWTVWREYVDHDTSGSSKRPRPRYEEMLVDLEAGRLDGILCWDVDRLARKPIELEKIIDLADRHGIALATVSGVIDLATPDGRSAARLMGSVARQKSERMSRRFQEKSTKRAEEGRFHGHPPYGWRREEGRYIIDHDQAKIVEEIVDRILAGESMVRIARDLQERGVPPVRKDTWSRAMVHQIALRPANAGLRVHRGEILGPGKWDPIISREKYERVKAYLASPERRTSSAWSHSYLLSGIARCGRCGGKMRVMSGKRSRTYVCSQCFGVRRAMEPVDRFVTDIIKERLNREDARKLFAPPDYSHLYKLASSIEQKLTATTEMFERDEIYLSQFRHVSIHLRAQLDEILLQFAQLSSADTRYLVQPDMIWEELPMERKRVIVAALLDVTILQARAPGVRFDPTTVAISWRQGLAPPADAARSADDLAEDIGRRGGTKDFGPPRVGRISGDLG